MAAITTTPKKSTLPRRSRSAVLWLAVGGVLGATVSTVATSDEADRPRTEPAAIAAPAAAASTVTASANAAERWALAELQQRRTSCVDTHHTPDAVERCLAG